MLGDTISCSFAGAAKVLNRNVLDGMKAEYYLDDRATSNRVFRAKADHTLPKVAGGAGESHLFRFDVDQYDTASPYALLRTTSAWVSIRTTVGYQTAAEALDTGELLVDFLSDANITKIVNRES